jgi:glutaredoxin
MNDTSKQIVINGAEWCPDARRARRFLDEHHIDYQWNDIDKDSQAKEYVKQVNNGQVVIPVIVFPDESILVEPSNDELSRKLESLSKDDTP